MSRRLLIVNADDYGCGESTNRAIEQLLLEKRISSASLMAPAPAAAEAAETAAREGFPVGVHWTLNSDWPQERWNSVAGPDRLDSLTDGEGLLADNRLLARQAKSAQVSRELEAQVRFLLERGCAPDHADSHCGTLYGTNGRLFFINAFRLCRKYRLPFRFPRTGRFLRRQYGAVVPRAVSAAHGMISGLAALMGVSLIDDMITNPFPIRQIASYRELADYYLREVAEAGEGVTEVFLHPAFPDGKYSAWSPEWAKREMEYAFLQSEEWQKWLEKEDITLVSWKQAFAGGDPAESSGK